MNQEKDRETGSGLARVLTALIGAPLILVAAYLGGFWFAGVVLIISVCCILEVRALFASAGAPPFLTGALLLALLVVGRPWIPGASMLLILVSVGIVASLPFQSGEKIPERTAATFFAVIYPVWLLSFLLDIRIGRGIRLDDADLAATTILIFLLVWAADTFAFYLGRGFGSKPFFPSISPRKTWEGFFGGLIGTVAVGVAAKASGLIGLGWTDIAVVTSICAIGGPVGDLVESKLKRSFSVKDSGTLLPGHGGMLDRFDAILICAPLTWLYLSYTL